MADFVSRTQPISAVRQQLQQQLQGQLREEAKGLLPDTETITEALMKNEGFYADNAPISQRANLLMGDYMKKYRSDPFYAFSKEARQTAAKLQSIATNPALQRAEAGAKQAREVYKTKGSDLANYAFVDNGRIAVLNSKTGERELINPDKFDANIHQALTVQNDFNYLENVEGIGRRGAYNINMADAEKTYLKIFNQLKAAGSDTVTEDIVTEQGVVRKKTKSSANKLTNAIDNLTIGGGLTQAEKDTLAGEYYATTGDFGPGSRERANQWIRDKITNMASTLGDEESSTTLRGVPGQGTGIDTDGDGVVDAVSGKSNAGFYSMFFSDLVGNQKIVSSAQVGKTLSQNPANEVATSQLLENLPRGMTSQQLDSYRSQYGEDISVEHLPMGANPIISNTKAPGAQIETLGGTALDGTRVYFRPGGTSYMITGKNDAGEVEKYLVTDALYVYQDRVEFGLPDELVQAKSEGTWQEEGDIGDLEGTDAIINSQREFSEDIFGHRGGENVYSGQVKVKLSDDAAFIAHQALDGQSYVMPSNSFNPQAGSTRMPTYLPYEE